MQTLNWYEKSLRWFDMEYNRIAVILMSKINEELTIEEIEHWYNDGFVLEMKKEDRYVPLQLEDLKAIAS